MYAAARALKERKYMRFKGSNGFGMLVLFLIAGALIGGILGQILGSVSLSGVMPYLTQTYEIFNFRNIHLNLAILQLDFGLRFAPNLISIIGILIAAWIFHRV